jgi:hypothetical protein
LHLTAFRHLRNAGRTAAEIPGHKVLMKKVLLILGVLAAIVVVALLVISFSLGTLVRQGVNRVGPELTKTSVTLQEARLSPFSGTGTLRGLQVGNPEGWGAGNAFSLGEVHIELQPRTLWKDAVVIDSLIIQRPEFVYEQRLTGGSNLKQLIDNIRQAIGSPAERPIGEPEEPPRRFIIKQLRLEEGLVRVGLGVAGAEVPLPTLAYENLGVQEGGLTAAQIAQVVLSDVLGRVIGVATSKGILSLPGGAAGEVLDAVGGALQKSGGSLEKLLGGRREAPEKKKE